MKKRAVITIGILLIIGVVLSRSFSRPNDTEAVSPRPVVSGKLEATISASQPVIWSTDHNKWNLSYQLVNKSSEVIDPKIECAKLVVNGKKLGDAGVCSWVGPVPVNFNALPPGGKIEFNSAPGNIFDKAGDNTLRWEGEDFVSPGIRIRAY